MNYINI